MLTNPASPIWLRSTRLNLKWGKKFETGKEMFAVDGFSGIIDNVYIDSVKLKMRRGI